MSCDCEFAPYEDGSDEESWHYKRVCPMCFDVRWSLHCPHDGHQTACMECGFVERPTDSEGVVT